MEGLPGDRKRTIVDKARSLANMAALSSSLFAFDNGPVLAADIPANASWETGVSELKKSVTEAPVEHATDFILYSNDTSEWLPTIAGVTPNRVSNKAENNIAAQLKSTEAVAKVCSIHTHPRVALAAGIADKTISIPTTDTWLPPSEADVNLAGAITRREVIRSSAQLHNANVTSMVFDPKGAWVWRIAERDEVERGDPAFATATARLKIINREIREFEDAVNKELINDAVGDALRAIFAKHDPTWKRTPDAYEIIESNIPAEDLQDFVTIIGGPEKIIEMRAHLEEKTKLIEVIKDAQHTFFRNHINMALATNDANFKENYAQLKQDYLRVFQAKVSFFTYDELKHLPPCPDPTD